jgi:hypothetical protein
LPPKPNERVALLQKKTVTGICQIVYASATTNVGVKQCQPAFIPAIKDIEEQDAIRFGAVDGPQTVDVGNV